MKMRGGFEQCYNAQAAVEVDSMLIVGQHVTEQANDKQQLAPVLEAARLWHHQASHRLPAFPAAWSSEGKSRMDAGDHQLQPQETLQPRHKGKWGVNGRLGRDVGHGVTVIRPSEDRERGSGEKSEIQLEEDVAEAILLDQEIKQSFDFLSDWFEQNYYLLWSLWVASQDPDSFLKIA
jgi:hypothetical protein